MKSSFFLCMFIFSVVLGSSSSAQDNRKESALKAGMILPLTGRASTVGTAILNGATLALERLSPQARAALELTVEDDGSDPKSAVLAYQKLRAETNCPVVISAMSNSGTALAPLTERDGVTHVALAFDTGISRGKQQTFTFWSRLADMAPAAVAEMKRLGYRNVAMVVTSHEGNIAMRRAVLSASGDGITYPVSLEILPGEADFSSVVSRLRTASGLDAVANFLHPGQAGVFVKQAAMQGLRTPQFAMSSFEDSAVRKTAGKSLLGQWYIAAVYSPDFIKKYRARFPESSISGAAYGHDVVLMLAGAAMQSVSPSASDIAAYLRNINDFHGGLSRFSSDGENGFRIETGIKIVGEDGLQDAQ